MSFQNERKSLAEGIFTKMSGTLRSLRSTDKGEVGIIPLSKVILGSGTSLMASITAGIDNAMQRIK